MKKCLSFFSFPGVLGCMLSATLAQTTLAENLDINLSNHTVQAGLNFSSPWANTEQQISALYTDRAGYDQVGRSASYGLYTGGRDNNIAGRIGGKAMWLDTSKEGGGAIALGGELRLLMGSKSSIRVTGHYAPSVLSFSDISNYKEYGAHWMYSAVPNTFFYVGVKYAKMKMDSGRVYKFQDGFNVGFELQL